MSKRSSWSERTRAAALASAVAGTVAHAEQPHNIALIDNRSSLAQSYRLDVGRAGSPGFVVNIAPKELFEPGNLSEFVLDLANFVENGRLKAGVAVNLQPFWMFNSHLTLEEYAGYDREGRPVPGGLRPWQRIVARTQIGLAAIDGASEITEDGVRLGFGMTTELLGASDPRNVDHAECRIKAYDRFAPPGREEVARQMLQRIQQAGGDLDESSDKEAAKLAASLELADYDRAVLACNELEKYRVENAPSWIVGGGFAASSIDASFAALEYSGASLWSSSKFPFAQNRSFQLFAKADFDRPLFGEGGLTSTGNAFHGAAALSFVDPGAWNLNATASYHWQDANANALDDDYFQFSVGGAFKVRDGVWLEGSFGTRTGARHRDESFSLLQLKFDASQPLAGFLGN
jgi:hypothetical protein